MVLGKLTKEQVLKGLQALSDEERAEVIEEMQKPVEPEPAPEPVAEPANPEEIAKDEPEVKKVEEVKEETPAPVEEVKEGENPEPAPETETPAPIEENPVVEENKEDVVKGLTDRIAALEEALKEFDDLKARMEEYTNKQAEKFGYKGAIPDAKKGMDEMSAAELKSAILQGK